MRASLLAFAILGCSSQSAQTVTLAAPSAAARPTASAPALPKAVAAAPPRGNACLMLYECGCNAGCTAIDRPLDGLTPGTRVGVTSGPLKGTSVYVAQSRTAEGESVLTVQRANPSSPIMLCEATARGPLVGYLCAAKDSGAARACGACE